MLRMSKLTDYGIVVMSHLATESGRPHTAAELALETQVNQPTVSKILKLLTREGLLDSYRGAKGGYRLARGADAISMAEIIDALEGPIAITECSSEQGACDQEPHCSVSSHWQWINRTIHKALDDVSLAEMTQATQPRMSIDPHGTLQSFRGIPVRTTVTAG
ncbi:MAG: SUF system Fe-S cluster assembly regulator [Proteobacteria bacterium]|nr:MAG: SUF system Fe-S cluster assembly regulator [Pseudomonadota bacterium]QKK12100.1 MAG: SUF system Fe-S cluster assembly regulator [Pseudomonadota bacterium]